VIAKLIELHMRVNCVSCRDLAKEIGTSKSTISRMANGERIDAETMLKVINWLFGGEVVE
jgi:DNA-binding Xre family transcriptional regulator